MKDSIKEKDREFIQLSNLNMWTLKELLQIKENKCHYCKTHIKKGDKFSIFNKPTRLICNSILCVTDAVGDDE